MGLVVFDLDGVLVDTQEAETGALIYLGQLMGLRLTSADGARLFGGRKLRECIDLLETMASQAPPDHAVEIVREKCEELIGPHLQPIDGVAAALAGIQLDMCVASNSPRELMRRRLWAAGLGHHFGSRLYSAYDINSWKPDPALFIWAARSCGFEPGQAIVVEDSAVGVQAGVLAGMRVLHFQPGKAGTNSVPGVIEFSDMRQLPGLVHMLRKGSE